MQETEELIGYKQELIRQYLK